MVQHPILQQWGCGCGTKPDPTYGVVMAPCEYHGRIWERDAAEFVRLHPDGSCTETCGCKPWEEIKKYLDEDEA